MGKASRKKNKFKRLPPFESAMQVNLDAIERRERKSLKQMGADKIASGVLMHKYRMRVEAEVYKAVKEILGTREAIMDVFSGDATTTKALVKSGQVAKAYLIDRDKRYTSMNHTTSRKLGIEDRIKTIEIELPNSKQILEGKERPELPKCEAALVLSTGLSLPSIYRLSEQEGVFKSRAIKQVRAKAANSEISPEKAIHTIGSLISVRHIHFMDLHELLNSVETSCSEVYLADHSKNLETGITKDVAKHIEQELSITNANWQLNSVQEFGTRGMVITKVSNSH